MQHTLARRCAYLRQRGLDGETVRRFQVGWAPDDWDQLARHLRAVSPQHTLERGYAVVRHGDGAIVRDRAEVDAEELLRVTVARGDFAVRPVSR